MNLHKNSWSKNTHNRAPLRWVSPPHWWRRARTRCQTACTQGRPGSSARRASGGRRGAGARDPSRVWLYTAGRTKARNRHRCSPSPLRTGRRAPARGAAHAMLPMGASRPRFLAARARASPPAAKVVVSRRLHYVAQKYVRFKKYARTRKRIHIIFV